ncbi:hypothetical protein GQ457_04G018890 [Hibiscus cannabinus]
MTKANTRNQIYELDPEIERTRRELRQRARQLMAHRGKNHQNPAEEQDPPRRTHLPRKMEMMLDASANGTVLDKPPREGLEILEKIAQNDYQRPTTRRGNIRRGTAQLDSSNTMLAHIFALRNMVKSMQR